MYRKFDMEERAIRVNGVIYLIPSNIRGYRLCVIDDRVYIDHYVLKRNGKWKSSFKAFWHNYIAS